MTVNVYQRRHVIKHYAAPNHDAQCRTFLTLGEMGYFVAFSGSPSYPSLTAIPLQIEMRVNRVQYLVLFDGSGTMTMIPWSDILLCVRGDTDPPLCFRRQPSLEPASCCEKGFRIVKWRTRQFVHSDMPVCAPLCLRCSRRLS
ncbi:hypothetical protein TNCV_3764151 [Trichonephila clavipes]|uniref:Uncharacterized protein n=1 Tax=Trichonephila clavipes TaxID=2585209 RepID=A0A8X7B888_TRICX|nr:hypothetical protein TNCV_3764151 [Trichonephila clavipes]